MARLVAMAVLGTAAASPAFVQMPQMVGLGVRPTGAASTLPTISEPLAGDALPERFGAEPPVPTQDADEPSPMSTLKWLGAGLLAGLVMAVASAPAEAFDGRVKFTPENFTIKKHKRLELCVNNKKFHKRIKDQIFKLTKRQNKYPKGSVVFKRFDAQIAQVKRREEAYGGRYCGKTDGLPRTIATGENVRGGVVVPALLFLYIAGWIGWAGRSYLIRTKDPAKEIKIDVPLAVTCMASGFSWPVAAWQEIVNGELVQPEGELHISGRAAP